MVKLREYELSLISTSLLKSISQVSRERLYCSDEDLPTCEGLYTDLVLLKEKIDAEQRAIQNSEKSSANAG